jgi:hypothetical protein
MEHTVSSVADPSNRTQEPHPPRAGRVNWSVVAFLYGPAAPGGARVDGDDRRGHDHPRQPIWSHCADGRPLPDLVATINPGNAYINMHTTDTDATTTPRPGDLPGGDIRGRTETEDRLPDRRSLRRTHGLSRRSGRAGDVSSER